MFKIIYWIAYVVLYPFYRYHFVGRENIPDGACILCGNHSTNSDCIFMVLANGAKGDYGFIAKEELFRIPLLGWLIRALHAFPVKRGSGDLKAIKTGFSILKAGKKLLLFPEGTRVHNGISVRTGNPVEPKSGAVIFSVRAKAPLVPIYVPEGKKVFRRNTIYIGKPYYPVCSSEKPSTEDYRCMTAELMKKIYGLPEKRISE